MSFTLPTRQEKAGYVKDQFERIAARYDLTNDVISLGMHRLWKEKAVDALACQGQGSYLDVCCGTGDLALTIAGRLDRQGRVTGLDFSANMLAAARARAAARDKGGAGNSRADLVWVEGDAQHLPFPDNTFDGAIISFGLRNLTDLQVGIDEMARVVKPGGQIVNLDLGHPTLPLFTPLFTSYFRHLVPLIGQLLQQDRQAYTYLPESARTYPKAAEISAMFARAGLLNISHQGLALGSVSLHAGEVA